jgi:predicted SPOUT superfamily RNA methylase MTH1
MKIFALLLILAPSVYAVKSDKSVKNLQVTTIQQPAFYGFSVKDAKGANINLSEYKNKVVLVVNVASKCGYTSQYEGLQKLYEDYQSKNFVVLGFPSNQFFI